MVRLGFMDTTPGQKKLRSNVNEMYSTFPKAPGYELHHQMVLCHFFDTRCGVGSYPCVEMQLVYSTPPTDIGTHDSIKAQSNR